MSKITPNDLINPTEKIIKNHNCSFIAVEGPNILDKLSLEDLTIPYESQYRSRIVLKAGDTNQPLIYGLLGKATTFLMIKATYDSVNDPYYQYEQEKYNITYYFENDPVIRPLNRLMIMTGSVDSKIPQIYLNNPLDYDVVLDILHATIDGEYGNVESNGFGLIDLSDVVLSGLTSGDTLIYNGSVWINKNVADITSGTVSLTGSSNNGILTLNGTSPNVAVQSGLTYNGSILSITGDTKITGTLIGGNRYSQIYFRHGSQSPITGMTYYYGDLPDSGVSGDPSIKNQVQSMLSGYITDINVYSYSGTVGSAENSTINVYNITKGTYTLVTNTIKYSVDNLTTIILGTSSRVDKGDILTIQWLTPVWITPPLNVINRITLNVKLD
jgi:hypothetical protein